MMNMTDMIHPIEEWIHFLIKWILHQYTGECEIERICISQDDGRHTAKMTILFANAIRKSKQLPLELKGKLFQSILFPVSLTRQEIYALKHISLQKTPLLLANVMNCLHALRLMNAITHQMESLRHEVFTDNNPLHNEGIELLWTQLRPESPRTAPITGNNGLRSDDWSLLGFQGKDPSTDFRGMGYLGLVQLLYFTKRYAAEAKELLSHSQEDDHYFPFAITGINITAFIHELLLNTSLHGYIFYYLDEIILQDTIGSPEGYSQDPHCISLSLQYIHDLYCQVFLTFGKEWKKRNPQNVMAFPGIFQEVKEQFRVKLSPLAPMHS